MTAPGEYLLQANLALMLVLLIYCTVPGRLTFYNLNRVFLLSGILISFLFPLLNVDRAVIPEYSLLRTAAIRLTEARAVPAEVTGWNPLHLLITVFRAGVGILVLRLLVQLSSLYRIHRESVPASLAGYGFRQSAENIAPFSFLGTIYLNPALHPVEELTVVLRHEQSHVCGWHTVDLLLAELATAFCWYNPAVWLLKSSVRENLEFIADQRVTAGGVDPRAYQYMLLRMSGGERCGLSKPLSLTSSFTAQSLRQRISRMNRERSPSRFIALYPVLTGILLSVMLLVKSALAAPPSRATDNRQETPAGQGPQARRAGILFGGFARMIPSRLPPDTLPGTAALIRQMRVRESPSMIFFLKDSRGRGIDLYVSFRGEEIEAMKVLATAPDAASTLPLKTIPLPGRL